MSTLLLIAGMTAVTYIPRLVPFLMIREKKLPRYIRRFLEMLPVAALGALIFPGVMASTEPSYIGIAATAVAGIIAWFGGGMTLAVIGGIAAAFGLLAL